MTIIKPDQYKSLFTFLPQLLILVVLGGVLYIYQYNIVADNRYEIEYLQERIAHLQVVNAELENELYEQVDPNVLTDIAQMYQLVLERSPQYLNVNQWVSDSSY